MSKKRALLSDSSDDEDLEEQLLNLSKKKTKIAPTPAPQKDSDDSDDNNEDDDTDSSTDDGDDDWSADGKVTKKKKEMKKKGAAKKPVKKRATISSSEEEGEINDDEDEDQDDKKSEDGQASSGSSSSSSDDGSDEELAAFDDGLDENLMGDEEDRLKLEQMTEVEREQELFNRMEKREALKTRREIQSKLHAERKKEQKQNKKDKSDKGEKSKDKSGSFNGTISENKEVRRNTVDDKKKSALDELKEKRLQKKEKMDSLIKKKEPLTTKDVYSDDDDDDEDDDDKDENEKDKDKDDSSDSSDSSGSDKGSDKDSDDDEEEEDEFLETLDQLEQIRLSRHKLEQWVHLPFFSETISGCYIRMGIGQHDGRSVYRVAEIADVTETPKVYALGKTRTNKGLKVKHGLQERVFRMEYISNQPFTESEFNKWKDEMKSVELPLPTLKYIRTKKEEINKSKNYTYKDDDIDGIIEQKAKFRKNPFNYAVKKNSLLMQKAIASQSKDFTTLERVTGELDDLEDRAVFLDKQRSGNLGNISFVNEKNRKTNVYAAEEAVLEESRLLKGVKRSDPFTRRRTLPAMITKGSELLKNQLRERDGTGDQPAQSEDEPQEQVSEIDSLLFSPSVSKKLENANNSTEDADLFNVHDFDVQIDVSIPASRSLSLTPKPMVGQRDGITRRSLNLDEYKKRKGLM